MDSEVMDRHSLCYLTMINPEQVGEIIDAIRASAVVMDRHLLWFLSCYGQALTPFRWFIGERVVGACGK